jgi:Phosphoesterase family
MARWSRPMLGLVAAAAGLTTISALAGPASGAAVNTRPANTAPANTAPAKTAPAKTSVTAPAAAAGTNLLGNGAAEVGAGSHRGYDEVIIPGWKVIQGLPTVVRYGATAFPDTKTPGPAERGANFFAGGAGGTGVLTQVVPLVSPDGGPLPAGATFTVAGWLGGLAASKDNAALYLTFQDANGATLSDQQIGPVTHKSRGNVTEFVHRTKSAKVPVGTVDVLAALVMTTTATNFDGYNGSVPGYNQGFADDLSLTVSTPVRAPLPPTPSTTSVPAYDHVFVVMMENEDLHSIIGNTWQAPYLNSLLSKGSTLANMYAEVHPSDPNYLALSAGTTFSVMGNPIETNPAYTLDAPNIGDLVDSAGKSWKAYYQSANGPCDNTVHDPYYNDDLPFLFFKDIKDNPARCQSHLVPLPQMAKDLQSTATTPSFSWWGADDCFDMEGCGIKAGDTFLQQTIGQILASPAWRTQRSLLVVTFDEDGYDLERPAQLVPTIILGSQGVKQGYVSLARYDHYNLLRTIEGALGLGRLTANDRYAEPMADIFG